MSNFSDCGRGLRRSDSEWSLLLYDSFYADAAVDFFLVPECRTKKAITISGCEKSLMELLGIILECRNSKLIIATKIKPRGSLRTLIINTLE